MNYFAQFMTKAGKARWEAPTGPSAQCAESSDSRPLVETESELHDDRELLPRSGPSSKRVHESDDEDEEDEGRAVGLSRALAGEGADGPSSEASDGSFGESSITSQLSENQDTDLGMRAIFLRF